MWIQFHVNIVIVWLQWLRIQLTPDNLNLQGKFKQFRVIKSLSYLGWHWQQNNLKGKQIYFELEGSSSYQEFELLGINCTMSSDQRL